MKNKRNISLFLLLGLILLFTNRCGEDDSENSTVTDIDGNVYQTVTIGTQVWMVENLKTTKFRDGTSIQNITDESEWYKITSPAYCWYNNDISNKRTYGALYNWYAVNTGKLAPTGWHVPTDDEWTTLYTYLGGADFAGGKMKETGTAHWESPNTGATNMSGFTGLPGGFQYGGGYGFNEIRTTSAWWSSTAVDPNPPRGLGLSYNMSDIFEIRLGEGGGYSVRCIRDN